MILVGAVPEGATSSVELRLGTPVNDVLECGEADGVERGNEKIRELWFGRSYCDKGKSRWNL